MSPALLSVGALALVIVASLSARLNVGVLAIALAWPVAVYGAGWSPNDLLAVFPSSLFLTLVGVSLLFGAAQANGTMEVLTHRALAASGGRAAWLPAMFFGLACVTSTLGPGAIASTALLAPLAMAAGGRAGVPSLLTALMVANGANAGNLSPFSAVGVIVADGMTRAGLEGHAWSVWGANFAAHLLAAAGAWLLFGGPRLLRVTERITLDAAPRFTRAQQGTLAIGASWVLAVVLLDVPLGLAAFAAAAVLVLARAAEDGATLRQVPWAVVVMVCGVSVLVGVLDRTGGMALFTTLLSRIATPETINGVIAFVTGAISTYSSTSGVVYPAFLPTVPGLVAQLGGGDPLEIALSINVGAALVDVSPLSTLGALCIAALPSGDDPKRVFRRLLFWSFSMTVAGALFCQLLIGWFAV